jgi:glycosyltransferase involved in cell wall biosynthesis
MELVIPGECVSEHVGIVELVFVDDSADDTRWVIQQVAAHSTVSLLRRRPRERTGGLSGAVADGILAAFTEYR